MEGSSLLGNSHLFARASKNQSIPTNNAWCNNENQDDKNTRQGESSHSQSNLLKWCPAVLSLLYGLLLGALVAGVALAVFITLWLVPSTTTTVTTVGTTTTIVLPSQCSSYTIINDTTRLATAAGASLCDQSLFSSNVTIVRFSYPGGTQIVTTPPNINLCGTQATGWYNGAMPAFGLTDNGTVCYNWGSSTCNWSNMISVTNCSSFYVYGLIMPPVCNLRYCTV